VRAQGKNVLRKEPMSRDVAEADVFVYNAGFSSKFYKVKIGTVSAQKESEPEKQETRQKARARVPNLALLIAPVLHSSC
jgi:cullin 3